jgi:hypothetical protein
VRKSVSITATDALKKMSSISSPRTSTDLLKQAHGRKIDLGAARRCSILMMSGSIALR